MKRAFTLIEVLIVLAIIGIIAATAIPAFNKARNQARNQQVTTTQAPPPDLRTQPVPGYTQLGTKTINVAGVDVQAQIVQNVAGDKFYLYTNNGVPTFIPTSDFAE